MSLQKLNTGKESNNSSPKIETRCCFNCQKHVTVSKNTLKKEFCVGFAHKAYCNTHLIYYEEADFRTLLFESSLCSELAFKSLVFQSRFKSYLETITVCLLMIYTFVDLAFKFKLLGQSKKLDYEVFKRLHPGQPEPRDLVVFRENSIFEMYLHSSEMRAVIHKMLGESLLQLSLAVNLIYVFYKTVLKDNIGIQRIIRAHRQVTSSH